MTPRKSSAASRSHTRASRSHTRRAASVGDDDLEDVLIGAAIAAASSIVVGIAGLIAGRWSRDGQLSDLLDQLRMANDLYAAARKVTEEQKAEINRLRAEIERLRQSGHRNAQEIEALRKRLLDLMEQLKRQSTA